MKIYVTESLKHLNVWSFTRLCKIELNWKNYLIIIKSSKAIMLAIEFYFFFLLTYQLQNNVVHNLMILMLVHP